MSPQPINFVFEALYIIDGALENRSFVGLSYMKVQNDVVKELVRLWQQSAQFFDSVIYVEPSTPFDCKLN